MFFLPLFSFVLGAVFLFAARSAPDNTGNTAVGAFFLAVALVSFLLIRKKRPRSASSGTQAPRAASGPSPLLKILLAWIAWGVLFVCFFRGFRLSNLFHTILLVGLSFVAIIVFTMLQLTGPSGRARRAAAARQPAAAPQRPAGSPGPSSAEDSGSITFRVAGTTFDNDDGTSRQDILRHLKFGDAPWADDPDDLVATIEEETYEGEPAFAVLINGYQVGFVPRTRIPDVEKARRNVATCYVSDVQITGGGYSEDGQKLSYGCTVTLEY